MKSVIFIALLLLFVQFSYALRLRQEEGQTSVDGGNSPAEERSDAEEENHDAAEEEDQDASAEEEDQDAAEEDEHKPKHHRHHIHHHHQHRNNSEKKHNAEEQSFLQKKTLKNKSKKMIKTAVKSRKMKKTFKKQPAPQTKSVNYVESTHLLMNPERGRSLNTYTGQLGQPYRLLSEDEFTLGNFKKWKVSTTVRLFDMGGFMSKPLDDAFLQNVQADFDTARALGIKIVVRFVYSQDMFAKVLDAPMSLMLTHISQFAPVVNRNKDVVALVQAGLIGAWGEWYYTSQDADFGHEGELSEKHYANRKMLMDTLLEAIDPSLQVATRYPKFKYTMYGSDPLTPETAYKNTPNARIAFHNDALLNTWGDQGFWAGVEEENAPPLAKEFDFFNSQALYLSIGGEHNGVNKPRTDCAGSMAEFKKYHYTYVSPDAPAEIIPNYVEGGCYKELQNKLGYRYVLKSANFDEISNGQMHYTVNLSNDGNALPIKNTRSVYLIFRDTLTKNETRVRVNWNLMQLGEIKVDDTVQVAPGSYDIFVHIPDPAPTISSRPEYAIQFANKNVWERTTGYNKLFPYSSEGPSEEDIAPAEEGHHEEVVVVPAEPHGEVVVPAEHHEVVVPAEHHEVVVPAEDCHWDHHEEVVAPAEESQGDHHEEVVAPAEESQGDHHEEGDAPVEEGQGDHHEESS